MTITYHTHAIHWDCRDPLSMAEGKPKPFDGGPERFDAALCEARTDHEVGNPPINYDVIALEGGEYRVLTDRERDAWEAASTARYLRECEQMGIEP